MKAWAWACVAVLAISMTSGCASLGAPYQPVTSIPDGKALVYIYRPSSFVGGGVSYTVHAGEEPVIKLYNGGYTAQFLDPGETEFWAKTEARASVTENLKPGKTYYLQGGVGVGFIAGRPKLAFVPESTGRLEITGCKAIPKLEAE